MSQALLDTNQLSLLRRVDAVCLRFEDCWLSGQRPELETFLSEFHGEERQALLAELLLQEWNYRRQRGEVFSQEEYTRRFAPLADVVVRAWEQWQEHDGGALSTVAPEALQTMPGLAPPPPTRLLPDYEEFSLVGKGGMGEVHRAFDPRLKRWVAIKQVGLDQITPARLAAFQREAEALAKLQHPHIVKVHDCVECDGYPVLVMEYIACGSLEERLHGPISAEVSARLIAILAWAVHAAHQKGIVHRDLKPANVLMDDLVAGNPGNVLGGFPKISDFGLAMLAGDATAHVLSGAVVGTPAYMSPEQAAGRTREVGPKTDVWALGVILYRCLTGSLPFVGDTVLDTLNRIKTMKLAPLKEKRPDVPTELVEICMSCLQKDPARRPTAAALAARLGQLAGGPTQVIETTDEKKPRQRSRWMAWSALAAGLVAMPVLGVALWLHRSGPVDVPRKGLPLKADVTITQWDDEKDRPPTALGYLGRTVFQMPFNARVTVAVKLSEPCHAYLLALNPNGGKPQLLWPANAEGKPDDTVVPPRQAEFDYPAPRSNKRISVFFRLNDEPKGGLQAFAVLASRRELPAYQEWVKQHGEGNWRHLDSSNVWFADRTGPPRPVLPGVSGPRGSEEEVEGVPPLQEVVKSLGPADAVTLWAFPVLKKEE